MWTQKRRSQATAKGVVPHPGEEWSADDRGPQMPSSAGSIMRVVRFTGMGSEPDFRNSSEACVAIGVDGRTSKSRVCSRPGGSCRC